MRASRRLCLFLPVLAAVTAAGCAGRSRTRVPPPAAVNTLAELRADLDRLFSDPAFAQAHWGVEVLSLDRGDVLYERNSAKLFMPASNNKLLTAAAALVRLGPDFSYETRVATDGEVAGGVLQGNLVVLGAGDPTMAPRFCSGDASQVFRGWATRLKEAGLRGIRGDIVGVDAAFESAMPGTGWAWDDLAYGYAALAASLQFNDNLVTVEVSPASRQGDPASAKVLEFEDLVALDCRVLTGPPGSNADIRARRYGSEGGMILSGTVPLGAAPVKQAIAVEAPALFFLQVLKRCLEVEGMEVSASSVRVARSAPAAPLTTLLIHRSPPLSEILKPLLKVSQNLYAETLVRTLGRQVHGEGSHARGREVVEATLRAMALEPGSYSYADGSGLSRLNLVTPDQLVRVLRFMSRHPYFSSFYDALPVAGVDGTIQTRMKGTKAERNVRAKTGTIANVRCLSGYLRTADGELLAFAMMANNFLISNRSAEYVQDSALERLAAFSRR